MRSTLLSPGVGLPVSLWLERLSPSLAQATFAVTTQSASLLVSIRKTQREGFIKVMARVEGMGLTLSKASGGEERGMTKHGWLKVSADPAVRLVGLLLSHGTYHRFELGRGSPTRPFQESHCSS